MNTTLTNNEKTRILMICTGNTCRSPMAEYLARHIAEKKGLSDRYLFRSAGVQVEADAAVAENAVEALREIGIELAGHVPTPLSSVPLAQFDQIYVMSYAHKRAVLNAARQVPNFGNRLVVMDIVDPYGQDLDAYRSCRDALSDFLSARII